MQLSASFRNTLFAIVIVGIASTALRAQTTTTEEVPTAPSATAQAAPKPSGPPQFPPVDPANFTTDTPSKDTVNAFLHQFWGYDPDRIWQIQAIQKTAAPGVSKVTVLAAQKTNPQIGTLQFFTTPDGQHLISNEVMPFGARPFDAPRKILQAEANGPSRGATSKDLLLVEFADFECPHCKAAQPTVQRLLQDFPNARYVFENLPLTSIHTEAMKAALYSVCVAKLNGNDAFFKFADLVFENQTAMTPLTPEAKATVEASMKLAQTLNVNETPTLFVNGRGIPMGAAPYETLKKIVEFQAKEDK